LCRRTSKEGLEWSQGHLCEYSKCHQNCKSLLPLLLLLLLPFICSCSSPSSSSSSSHSHSHTLCLLLSLALLLASFHSSTLLCSYFGSSSHRFFSDCNQGWVKEILKPAEDPEALSPKRGDLVVTHYVGTVG
jgi:hypothetical protein